MNLFEGELVRLTHLQRDDLPAFKRWFRDYEVQRWLGVDPVVPLTDEAEEAWYEQASRSKDAFHFSIRTLADDRLIGNCSLFGISQKNRSAEFGIVIGEKEYWGRGYGSDATRIVLRFAFDEVNLNRVYLWVFSFNRRAIRAYEKCGFVHEGTARQTIFREGQYHDAHLMSVLRDEWLAMQKG